MVAATQGQGQLDWCAPGGIGTHRADVPNHCVRVVDNRQSWGLGARPKCAGDTGWKVAGAAPGAGRGGRC